MKLPDARIELAADDKESQYTMQAVKLDVPGKRLLATNGHILAAIPCEVGAEDHSALLSLESIKQMRSMQKRAKSVPIAIHTNGKATVIAPSESAEFELVVGQFPNVDMVIPNYEGPATITFNVDLLVRLAKAMIPHGDKLIVSLTVKDASSSILVTSGNAPNAVGVLMPCRP